MELQGDLFENHAVNELTKELGPGFDLILTNNRRIIVSVDRNHSPARARVSRLFSMADSETIRQLSRY
ncbi:MAG: hypothetical protein OEY50_09285, partial [Nitrospinota bacterium]|nr:hypothetical protein [Nitrospinota bacterium]